MNHLISLIYILLILILVVLILSIISLSSLLCTQQTESESFHNINNSPIDFVYTWVYEDDELLKDMEKYSKDPVCKACYRNNNELKYSLRSLEKYAPWYNRIYIVVRDGQQPKWLKQNHRLKFIEHSSIIPEKYLPTFNSLSIESFLHRIPNLSERYIYFNDDIILWNKVNPSMFFTHDNKTLETCDGSKLQVEYTNLDFEKEYNFKTLLRYNVKLLDECFPKLRKTIVSKIKHVPTPNFVSMNYKLDAFLDKLTFNKDISINEYTKQSKFRQNKNVARNTIFKKYFYIVHGKGKLTQKLKGLLFPIVTEPMNQKVLFDLLKLKIHVLCVQNHIHYPASPDNKNFELFEKVLQEKFSDPSCHEILM